MISARKAKQLDATTMFTYSHANTPLGQSEGAYYLSYFIIINARFLSVYANKTHLAVNHFSLIAKFVDNTLLDLQNSSYPTQPHSIIAKFQN